MDIEDRGLLSSAEPGPRIPSAANHARPEMDLEGDGTTQRDGHAAAEPDDVQDGGGDQEQKGGNAIVHPVSPIH
jgi:hypothetical protein